MNCNYKTIRGLSLKDRERLKNEISSWNREFLEREIKRMREIISNNLFKILCLACYEKYGFGPKRIENILEGVSQIVARLEKDPDVCYEIDSDCKKILGKEKYNQYFKDVPFVFN